MKSHLSFEKIEVVTTEIIPMIQLKVSIEEAWVLYNLCQHVGGKPKESARGILSDLDDLSLGAALEIQLAQHYNVNRDKIDNAQLNAHNPFNLKANIHYNSINVAAAIKTIELGLLNE